MRPGPCRDRVKIQSRTVVEKATGVDETWADIEIRPARVIPVSAKSRAEYAQIQTDVTHLVEFRGRVALSIRTNRLVWLTGSSTVLWLAAPPQYSSGMADFTLVPAREAF